MALWKFNSTITAEGLEYTNAEDIYTYILNPSNQITIAGDIIIGGNTSTLVGENYRLIPMMAKGVDDIIAVSLIDIASGGEESLYYAEVDDNNETTISHDYITNQTFELTNIGENVRPWLEANAKLIETPTEYIEVTYADKVFKLSAGQKITFKGGKVMQGDIVAKVSASGEVTLISFTIAGVSYQAEEDMTWAKWCNSEYNTDGYFIDGNFVRPTAGIVVTNANSNFVSPSSTIINGYAYSRAGAGGAD